MYGRIIVIVILAFALLGCAPASTVEIPVRDQGTGQMLARLEMFVYQPSGNGPFPVLILNHGSAGGSTKTSIPWKRDATYWSQRGYIVLAPMRRGRGKSTGISPESEEKNCNALDWYQALPLSMQDIDAAVEFSHTLPLALPNSITLIGVSRGGFLSVAYSAEGRYKDQVRSVVNFVGGWVAQAEDQCPQDFNSIAFERYGRTTKIKMLWLYGANDSFYGDVAARTYVDTFNKAGGDANFHLITGIPDNGHWLPEYPAKWQNLVDDFLSTTNAP